MIFLLHLLHHLGAVPSVDGTEINEQRTALFSRTFLHSSSLFHESGLDDPLQNIFIQNF